jgi:hypothetical protein
VLAGVHETRRHSTRSSAALQNDDGPLVIHHRRTDKETMKQTKSKKRHATIAMVRGLMVERIKQKLESDRIDIEILII